MLKKTITFTDYFDQERTQDFYFNLTKSELMEWEMRTDGGLERIVEKMIQTNDRNTITSYFKEIILKSYGEKSEDGFSFVKNDQLAQRFCQSPAYDILFMELATDAEKLAAFINGIVPKDISEQMKQQENTIGMNPALAKLQGKTIPLATAQASENS